MKLNMALLGVKRLHLIVTDSRGKGLGDLIRSKKMTVEPRDVLVRDGANLQVLIEAASKHLQKNPFDVVYIAGGACDITTKNRVTKQIGYGWDKGKDLEDYLLEVLDKADKSFKKEFPASKIIFCPLIASELSRVVTCGKVTPADQREVEEAVWSFNTAVFKINKERQVVSPSLHHQVHRFCKGRRRAYYYHLQDGLHLTDYLKNKWADEFTTVMAHN